MTLDNSQPWMLNKVIKIKILFWDKILYNDKMKAYQEEFNRMSLVEKE